MNTDDWVTIAAAFGGSITTSLIVFMAHIYKKLTAHDVALAVLINQVNPPNEKSLRELITELRIDAAHSSGPTIVQHMPGASTE